MRNSFFILGSCMLILMSCGTSKKLEQANAEMGRLKETNTLQAQKISAMEAENRQLKEENIVYSKEAEVCRKAEAALRAKKQKLDDELAARGTSLQQIESKAEAAVASFRNAGCEVEYRNGRFHITVPDEFTFSNGSASIGPKGREALNVVAQVMYDNPGVVTTIIGNTDTLSIKGVADNWSLSTERANAVVRILADVYNVNPRRLIAAGRSKFNPVASNDTPAGREKNRRIEIVINPRLDRIWDLLAE